MFAPIPVPYRRHHDIYAHKIIMQCLNTINNEIVYHGVLDMSIFIK